MGFMKSKPAPPKDFEEPWRNVDWNRKELLKSELRQFQLNHPEISHFRILLHGPVGAGKSCFINSVMSVFKGKIVIKAQEESSAGKSCTKTYKTYKITDANSQTLPFVLNDVMGLENHEEDGVHPRDIIHALHGHVKEDYKFNPASPLSHADPDFINDPNPNDKVHCLVSVVPADSITLMPNEVIQKMKNVRKEALSLGIPHVVLMTKIDALCPLAKKDLTEVYKSKKIKDTMEKCSHRLGPPVKCIFPVSNYYEECEPNNAKDVLILMAFKAIAEFIKDYIEDDNI
ncbi:interferon-induced protein 44-like [Neoarius graeffei]|uniref:interferon-induced protein 44-like n=1 Tax=Neoarius graeffei TaxID=443677 RepID=UPI00298D343D|nr:interferon-induced protein 44-like [Neoarius graeffei]XP_060754521.1 interferon-induced protein 44-like [Neoarius graeffei]